MGIFEEYYKNNSNILSEEIVHKSVDEEKAFYRAICNGDMDTIRKNCEYKRFHDKEGVGQLSKDPVLNLKYHMVITAAPATRLCIEKGLEVERAFRMSDFYIQQLDDATTIEQVTDIHDRMIMDYTGKIRLRYSQLWQTSWYLFSKHRK